MDDITQLVTQYRQAKADQKLAEQEAALLLQQHRSALGRAAAAEDHAKMVKRQLDELLDAVV